MRYPLFLGYSKPPGRSIACSNLRDKRRAIQVEMLYTIGLQQELAGTNVRVQLVLPASTATEIWDVAGIGVDALDQATVMTVEDCVDAALAGLDQGER